VDITIRRMRRTDSAELERFYAALSEESRRLRFFGYSRGISHTQAVSFCTPDHHHREGFVAVAAGSSSAGGLIVGHLCLEPTDESTAEVAIAVADAFQHRGIGRRLMAASIDWARSVGIHRFTATMLEANGQIQRLLDGLGLATSTCGEGPEMAVVTIDLDRPHLTAA
jgi:GNAT superfamily N-acetyltransferase